MSAGSWHLGDPFVVFGDDWGRGPSTMQHVFRHLAPDYPIIWVNGIGHRPPTLSLADARRAFEKARAMASPRLAHSAPGVMAGGLPGGAVPAAVLQPRGVLPWHQFGPIHRLNTTLLLRAIRNKLAELGLSRPPVLVTGSPPSVGVVGRLGEAASVYFCMDDFLNFPGVSAKMIAPLERRLLEKVDVLVATAHSLTISKRPASGMAYHVPQGVNYEHFSTPQAEPEEMRDIPHPRIGFAGSVGGYCDLELVAKVADAWPDCSVVLVGNVTADPQTLAAARRRNVFVLGLRPYRHLPAYLQAFDIGIVPYMKNATTLAVDPLKLLEYLAAGLPVVTTAIPEMAKYSHVVSVAPDDDTFVKAIGPALEGDRTAARERGQAAARANTWKQRADQLVEIIHDTIGRTHGAAPGL